MLPDDLEFLRRGYEAFGRGDVESALAMLHPEVEVAVHTERPDIERGIYRGREGFLANIAELTDVFEEFRLEPRDMVQAGERVLVVTRVTGRGKGSGVEIDASIFHVWTISEGRATRLEIYGDRESAQQALGSATQAG